MNKKFISAILAGAMAVSALSISAFAADAFTPATDDGVEIEKEGSKSYSISAGMQAVALNVTIPSSVKAVINPYGVKVTIEDVGETSADGVTSPVYTITNNTTNMGIIVKATASATIPKGSNATIDEAGSLTSDTGNKVYAEVKASIAKATAPASTTAKIIFKDSTKTGYTAASQQLLVLTKATEAGGKVTGVEGYFQISGELSGEPEKAFTTNDKVNYTLVLDIEPASAETGGAAATTKIGTGA